MIGKKIIFIISNLFWEKKEGLSVLKKIGLFALILFIIWSIPIFATESEQQSTEEISILVAEDEQSTPLEIDTVLRHGRIFVPVREFVDLFEGDITWDEEQKLIQIESAYDDQIKFVIDQPEVTLNGESYILDLAPFMQDGTTYVPIRHVAELMHIQISWDDQTNTITLTPVALHVKQEGEAFSDISLRYKVTPQLIMMRNGITSLSEVQTGDSLKVVIPYLMEHPFEAPVEVSLEPELPDEEALAQELMATEDFKLLAKIVQVEAGWESYEGQLAVANVVLNRVKDPYFPNTIHDVIYAPNQFPPAYNGKLDQAIPNESVKKATLAAMNGENNVEGALYFHNPRVSGGGFWNSLTLVDEIGNHRFYTR